MAARIADIAARIIITLIAFVVLALYCTAIYLLTRHGSTLIETRHKTMWWQTTYLRLLAVGLFRADSAAGFVGVRRVLQ